jgi:hypothetical protein
MKQPVPSAESPVLEQKRVNQRSTRFTRFPANREYRRQILEHGTINQHNYFWHPWRLLSVHLISRREGKFHLLVVLEASQTGGNVLVSVAESPVQTSASVA